jgi:hypothetical protein
MTDAEFQNKLAEYGDMVRLLTAKLEELAAENARLRSSENNAHSVLREVYNDPTASPAVRVKAAGLALSHESAPKVKIKSGPVLLKNEAKVGGANNHRQDYRHPCALERRRRSRCLQRRETLTHSRLRGIDWARQSLAQLCQAAPGAAAAACSSIPRKASRPPRDPR